MMKYATPQKITLAMLILLAGSCASGPERGAYFDPFRNHPISVTPVLIRSEFLAPDPAAQMPPDEATRLGKFVADYTAHGHGVLTILVPASPDSADITTYFGQKLKTLGIPSRHIRVGTHPAGKGAQVWLQYSAYNVKADGCEDWSGNVDFTWENLPTKNFGCATQYNLASQVDDPADLVHPRATDGSSGARRAEIIRKYEKGSSTASSGSTKSVKISSVGGS